MQADAGAHKRGLCECGSQAGCSLERPTTQVEKFLIDKWRICVYDGTVQRLFMRKRRQHERNKMKRPQLENNNMIEKGRIGKET